MTDRGCASPDHPSLAARVLVRRATRNAHPFLCADVVRSARRELSAACLASVAAICSCRLTEPLATRRAHLLRPCDGQRDPAALERARLVLSCVAHLSRFAVSLSWYRVYGIDEHCHLRGSVLCMSAGLVSIRHRFARCGGVTLAYAPSHCIVSPRVSLAREACVSCVRARARGAGPGATRDRT